MDGRKGMMEKKIKALFAESDKNIPIEAEKRQRVLEVCGLELEQRRKEAVYGKEQSPWERWEGKMQILRNQFLYMDKSMLAVQCLVGLGMLLLVVGMDWLGMERRQVIGCSMMLAGLVSAISLAGVSRIFTSSIGELSACCYFSAKQVVVFQMACAGVLNLAVLLGCILFIGGKWQVAFWQMGLYLLVPYVMTQCCCSSVLLTERGRESAGLLLVTGVFVSLLLAVWAWVPQVYQPSAMVFWAAAFGIGVVWLGVQLRKLLVEVEKGEIVCMN